VNYDVKNMIVKVVIQFKHMEEGQNQSST